MLLPHDWRDGRGAVRASVTRSPTLAGARARALVGHAPRVRPGRPRGLARRLPAPGRHHRACGSSVETGGAPLRHTSVARAIWLEPVIIDPTRPKRTSTRRARTRDPAPGPLRPGPGAPLISVLTPVHDPPPHMLEEAIASVRAQTFTDWELCLVDDGSTEPRGHRRARAPRRLRPPHPPHPPRRRRRDLRRHQHRARARHRRVRRPTGPRRHPRRPTHSSASPSRSPRNPTST